METFLSSLLKCPTKERRYYLQFIKLYLDERSRKYIKQPNSKLQVLLHQCKTTDEMDKGETAQFEAVNKASFGLEHVLRETGLVYEAAHELYAKSHRLPQVAAELLVEGYPLELLDGDSAYIPLEWVSTVLQKVIKMLNDPKIFVLSVLGLQSSGKSTLLNATFGLQFAVGAGRCTRGAFMQLLPICNELKSKLDCEYLLVVDTEGLRAPELGDDPKHDNELATFVIGLANVTMINIHGEILADIKDILHTVIYAFIRMRRVNLKPSCQFVHQNVPSASALSKGERGRHQFKETLDEVTKMIAKAEDVSEKFTCFSDVITFDAERDVHYFPPLWNGEIPMAHHSRGYCEKASVLRARIVELISKQSETISLFRRRLKDLWNALLHENFIMNFKNSLEAIAYKYLEAKYYKWTWDFKDKIWKWNKQSKMEIKNSQISDIPKLQERLEHDLIKYADSIHSTLNKKLESFFQRKQYHSTLIQYKVHTKERLNHLKETLMLHSREQCEQAVQLKRLHLSVDEIKDKHDKKIIDEIAVLADKLIQEQSDCDVQIKEEFDKKWNIWIQELSTECKPVQKADISRVFKDALEAEFKHSPLLGEKLKKDLNEWGATLSITIKKEHIKKIMRSVDKGVTKKPLNYRKHLQDVANQQLQQVEMYVKCNMVEVFDQINATKLIKLMTDSSKKMLAGQVIVSEEFMLDMNLIACGFAAREFERMSCEFARKYDPVEYFQGKKKFYYILFQRLHNRVATDVTAATSFCQLVMNPIKESVIASLGPAIVNDMKNSCTFLQTKSALKANILINLAEHLRQTENFQQYETYLANPDRTMWTSLVKYTNDYCMDSQARGAKNIVYLATEELHELLHIVREQIMSITASMQQIQESTINGSEWLSTVCRNQILQQKLHLDFQACHYFNDFDKVNKDTFLTEIFRGLEEFEKSLIEEFETMTEDDVGKLPEVPFVTLYNSMIGCQEICPFCGEQCESDFEHKSHHTVSQHRPQCLAGYKGEKTQEMILYTCNELIGTNTKFKNNDVTKWHRFKDYCQVYSKWVIGRDLSSGASVYWKWLLGSYPTKVSEVFGIKAATIPPQWKALKWEEVKEALLQDALISD